MDVRCRITSGEGSSPRKRGSTSGKVPQRADRRFSPQGSEAVRVKGCGKSAPRRRQRRRHGKPHREQNRIGTARDTPPRERRGGPRIDVRIRPSGWVARSAGQPAFQMNGRHAPGLPDQAVLAPHRTRLTGRLICEGGSAHHAGPPPVRRQTTEKNRFGAVLWPPSSVMPRRSHELIMNAGNRLHSYA
jgi:hypothetical protein